PAAALSAQARYDVVQSSGMVVTFPWLPLLWSAGFFAVAGANAWRLIRPPPDLIAGGSPLAAAAAVPLHATLAIVASAWFLLGEDHPAGLNIYLDKLTEQSGLYIQVGLYVWAGMLLKNTRIASRAFDVLRPWNLPAEILAAVVVVCSSVPVAYSGASGIFVIAAGSTIYAELRRAGARNQLALAATAMSGSLGVVLSPCLLVVVVAALNKSVTSDVLYEVGRAVFLLTAALFVGTMVARRQEPWRLLSVEQAWAGSQKALVGLAGYAAILVGVIVVYGLALGTWIDDHSAPVILLVAMLGMMLYEQVADRDPTFPRLAASTEETTSHIGALLTLMAFSVGFGGVIERSELMSLVPSDLGGPLPAMCLLVVALVIIGMLMEPYGAVILVSATLAHVAEQNGIHPAHFWMTVLVAFELGYLTPPVALNQLLTTAVVGRDAEIDDLPRNASFLDRYERYLLPVGVMGTALLIVAFGPLLS
ncbi:MAG TPA: TRAP transporter large permease subunit, partial [Myxococcota bacterium]|nr:TRAP transporter large permease subunit [Myxococcota bacterium]